MSTITRAPAVQVTPRPVRAAAVVLVLVAVSVTVVSALADPGHGSQQTLLMGLLVIRTGTDVAALGTIGALVLALCQPKAATASAALVRSAAAWAGIWTVLLATALMAELLTPSLVVAHGAVGPDASDVADRTRWLVIGVVLAGIVRVLAVASRSTRDTVQVLGLAVLGLVPATVTGHGSVSTEGWTATLALLAHVVAVSVWVGGLLALVVHGAALWSHGSGVATARRFSRVALLCYVGVAGSGVVTALAQTDLAQLVNSRAHAAILAGKVALLLVVGIAGALQRYVVLPRLSQRGPTGFLLLAAGELVLLGAALGLAVTLTHTAS